MGWICELSVWRWQPRILGQLLSIAARQIAHPNIVQSSLELNDVARHASTPPHFLDVPVYYHIRRAGKMHNQ
jgi:hypothetical protein